MYCDTSYNPLLNRSVRFSPKNAPQTEQCTCHLIFPDPIRLPPLSNNILIHLLLNGSKGNKIRLLSIIIVHSVSVKATRTITISMIQIRFVQPGSFLSHFLLIAHSRRGFMKSSAIFINMVLLSFDRYPH